MPDATVRIVLEFTFTVYVVPEAVTVVPNPEATTVDDAPPQPMEMIPCPVPSVELVTVPLVVQVKV